MDLQNNHPEMKTVVETFVIEETASLIYDNEQLDKWNELVAECNLQGQTQIVQQGKSPIPFLHLKRNLVSVFDTLCPKKVSVDKYNISPIPVEILGLIALAKKEQYFEEIQIWYDDAAPDPVCIGLRYTTDSDRRNRYSWNMEKYILGKWADVKRSFSELTDMATKRYIQEKTSSLTAQIRQASRELEDVELTAFMRFGSNVNGMDVNLPF